MSMFGLADVPWVPTLLDLERLKEENPARYGKYGFDQLDVPEGMIKARMDTLNTRFIARYGTRMLGNETLDIWQVRLQDVFDSVFDKYERAYTLYDKYKDQMMEDALPGEKTTVAGTVTGGGSDTTTRTSTDIDTQSGTDTSQGTEKHSDTPDSSINESDNFAGSIDKNTSSVTYGKKNARSVNGSDSVKYGRTDTTDMTTTRILTGGTIMDAVNKTVDGWRDMDTALIGEFENLFMNILWC